MAGYSERILVTGAQGFTGRALCQALKALGKEVVSLEDARGSFVDLCDRSAVDAAIMALKPTLVYHLAGIATNLHPDVGQLYQVNVVGTANLLAALTTLSHRPRGIIIASSVTVYGLPRTGSCLDEETPLCPAHHYGSSKWAAEEVARHFRRELPILIVRPFNYTGPGQSEDFVVAKLVQHFARRDPLIRMGNLEIARDFMALDSVVDVYCRLGQLTHFTGAVNIASGRAISLKEIIGWLETLTGHVISIETDPRFLRPDEVSVLYGSTDALHRLIGPVDHPPFIQVLAAMLEAARDQIVTPSRAMR